MSSIKAQKWEHYRKRTLRSKPRKILLEALPYVKGVQALDFGSGALNDSRYLLENGFTVTSIDVLSETSFTHPHFSHLEKTFEEYVPPKNTFDLVSAQFSIPFVSEKDFGRVWTNLVYSLKEGGIFTGQFFGLEDDWSENSSMTFHSDKQVRDLLAAFEIVVFREEKFVEKKERSKFWHFYEIIARKKHV